MRSAREISQRIRAQLKILDPEISAEPLTPERKIIDTVSEVIAESEVATSLTQYQLDIDTKMGSELDRFVALFGFGRRQGIRATGYITFSRTTPAKHNIYISARSQIMKPATSVSPTIIFRTVTTAIMYAGTSEVEVPIECVVPGEIGNVAANTITEMAFSDTEIAEITNENATSGGTNRESDAELRVRFRNQIFRNLSGTKDQYLALAVASRYAKRANVIGPVSRFIEYLQVEQDLSINSQIPYSKYTYPFDYYLTDGNLVAEIFYSPNGQDYTFTDNVPPTIAVDNTTKLPVGSVVLLEHSYCSTNSRNDPSNDILNAIDIYVSGEDLVTATESLQYPGTSTNFVNNSASKYHYANFQRIETSGTVAIGNKFQEVLWQPLTDLPDAIIIDNVSYFKGSHYWAVRDITNYRGSRRARNGIEWLSSVSVSEGTNYLLTYTFNRLPIVTNELIDAHKPVGADVLVHAANRRYFTLNFVIMYAGGFNASSVETAINTALLSFLEGLAFGSVIQVSDLVEVVHSVPGVDNVRLATASDGVSYGIQEVAMDGQTQIGYPTIKDFILNDSDLAVLNSVILHRRSQNTWTP